MQQCATVCVAIVFSSAYQQPTSQRFFGICGRRLCALCFLHCVLVDCVRLFGHVLLQLRSHHEQLTELHVRRHELIVVTWSRKGWVGDRRVIEGATRSAAVQSA